MKKRHQFVLLYAVPALLVALLASFALFGAAAGVLWIFVYGDNPWPAQAGTALAVGFGAAFVCLWGAFLAMAYRAGRKQEERAGAGSGHALTAAAISACAILFMLLYQWRVGNIGPRPDSVACADYCRSRGYAGSGTPPRNAAEQTCSCHDAQGREALKLPMSGVKP